MSNKKKEPKYIVAPPSPEAVALIMRGVEERKAEVMAGLVYALWEAHQPELRNGHGGDSTCSDCALLRTACKLLRIDHPKLAPWVDCTGELYIGEG